MHGARIEIDGRSVPIEALPFVVGRGDRADLRLDDLTLAGSQFALVEETDGVWLVHGGKGNPTRVNEQPVEQRRRLLDGDRIGVADLELRFVAGSDARLAAAADPRVLAAVWCAAALLALGLLAQILWQPLRRPAALARGLTPTVPPLPEPEHATAPPPERPALARLDPPRPTPPAPLKPARRPTPRPVRSSSPRAEPQPPRSPRPMAPQPPRPAAQAPTYGPIPLVAWAPLPPVRTFGHTLRGRGIVFVADQSSSMARLMPALQQELGRALAQLVKHHRFNIVFFDERMHAFETELVAATRANRERAWEWVRRRKAGGKTRALQALRTATAFPGADELLLLTDGALADNEYRWLVAYLTRRIDGARDTPCVRLVPLDPGIGRDARLRRLLALIGRQPELR